MVRLLDVPLKYELNKKKTIAWLSNQWDDVWFIISNLRMIDNKIKTGIYCLTGLCSYRIIHLYRHVLSLEICFDAPKAYQMAYI
jgi:hypothetical protein